MELNLHANATTTPKVRACIQRSKASIAELASEPGVSETTIRRWRGRTTVDDRSHKPKTLAAPIEEALVCELRVRLHPPVSPALMRRARGRIDSGSQSRVEPKASRGP